MRMPVQEKKETDLDDWIFKDEEYRPSER